MENAAKKKLLILVLVLAVFSGIGVMGMRYAKKDHAAAGKGLVLEENAQEWNKDLTDVSAGQRGIKIPGYADISVSREDRNWKITLVNPEENPCYFQYTLELAETGTILYESGLIEPGKAVMEFEPENVPEAGDYELYLNISTYSYDEDKTPMNGAQVKAELHII